MGLKFYVNVKIEQYWIENSCHFSAFFLWFTILTRYLIIIHTKDYQNVYQWIMQWNVIYIDLFGSRQMPICISVFSFVCALLCQILKDDNAETKCRRVFLHISYNFLFIIFSDLNFNALDVLQAWALSKFHFNVIWPYFHQYLYFTNELSYFPFAIH